MGTYSISSCSSRSDVDFDEVLVSIVTDENRCSQQIVKSFCLGSICSGMVILVLMDDSSVAGLVNTMRSSL